MVAQTPDGGDDAVALIFEREQEALMRVRLRVFVAFICLVWLYALAVIDPALYGSWTDRLPLRVLQFAIAIAGLLYLRRPRRLWQTELVAAGGGALLGALGATSLLKLPESTFGFGVAMRFFFPMAIGYILLMRWRAASALYLVNWTAIAWAALVRDPEHNRERLLLLVVIVGVPYPLLAFAAWWRERQQRRDVAMREALRAANERLRREEEMRTRLFVNLNHDFRTPLALIRAEAELLRHTLTAAPHQEALERIEGNSQYLAELSGQLLELARIESGQAPCQKAPTRADILAQEVAAQLQPSDGVPELVVEGPPVVVDADPVHVRRILFNLVENARRQPKVRSVMITLATENGRVTIDVADDGGGIDPARRKRLFERFASFDTDGSTLAGIGLPLSRELAELNGGGLELLPGHVTMFRLTLPASTAVVPMETTAVIAPATVRPPTLPPSPVRPVLLVEDNPEMRALLLRTLDGAFEVRAAATLAAAREALDEFEPAAVVSDVMLPDGRGTDLVALLRARRSLEGIPILLVSALSSVEDRIAGLKTGADDYLAKPFSPAELVARLRTAMTRSEARTASLRIQRENFVMDLHDGVTGSLARAARLLDAGRSERAMSAIRDGLSEARSLMSMLEAGPATLDAVAANLRREHPAWPASAFVVCRHIRLLTTNALRGHRARRRSSRRRSSGCRRCGTR